MYLILERVDLSINKVFVVGGIWLEVGLVIVKYIVEKIFVFFI